jgi:hypothetical protein
MTVRVVHGHGAGIHYRADDTAIGGTSSPGDGGHGGTGTGDQNLSSGERLRTLMESEAALKRNKVHGDRKIAAQGTENAELRRRVAALESEQASAGSATPAAGNSADVSYDPDDPDIAKWDQQRRINEELVKRSNQIVGILRENATESNASKRTSAAEQSHRDDVHDRHGTTLPADIEQYLVDARTGGDINKVLEAEAAVSAALRDGAADMSTIAAEGQLGVGGSGGMGSAARASEATPSDLSLSDEDLTAIRKAHPNDMEGQAQASMTLKLDRMLAGDTVT